jgi:hypothetical protein
LLNVLEGVTVVTISTIHSLYTTAASPLHSPIFFIFHGAAEFDDHGISFIP